MLKKFGCSLVAPETYILKIFCEIATLFSVTYPGSVIPHYNTASAKCKNITQGKGSHTQVHGCICTMLTVERTREVERKEPASRTNQWHPLVSLSLPLSPSLCSYVYLSCFHALFHLSFTHASFTASSFHPFCNLPPGLEVGGHGEWRFMQIYLIRWKKMRKIEIFLLGDIFVYHCLPSLTYHNIACFPPD